MSQIGVGACVAYLGGNEDSVAAWKSAVGKTIAALCINPDGNGGDGTLEFTFGDASRMAMLDSARSCCESRYMTTDDALLSFVGAVLEDAEVRDAPNGPSE